jgi:hypothetical protein
MLGEKAGAHKERIILGALGKISHCYAFTHYQ